MNKKLWIAGGVTGILLAVLMGVAVIGFMGWRYVQNRSAFSDKSFRNYPVELSRNMKHAQINAALLDDNAHVISVENDGTVHVGETSITSSSKTKDRQMSEALSSWTTSQAQNAGVAYVAASQGAGYEMVVEILRILAAKGFDRIGLVVGINGAPGFLEVKLFNLSEMTPIRTIGSETEIPLPRPDSVNPRAEPGSRPNPLSLLIRLNKDGPLSLNADSVGAIDDTAALTRKLSEVFKERESNGVFRVGTNEVEKTVHITASLSDRYERVVRVVDAAKGAGASPIILRLQDLRQ